MSMGHERRKAMSKFFISLAIFWLTTVPVSLLTDIGMANDGIEVLCTVVLGTVFAVIGIFVNKDEEPCGSESVSQKAQRKRRNGKSTR